MTNANVRITLTSQIADCPKGHKVGDTWTTDGNSPEGLCLGALGSILPAVTTLRFGGNFPWMEQKGTGCFSCPDHRVVNVFKLERIED